MNRVAASFDIIKWVDDYTLEDFNILYSHPSLEQSFMFHEDLLTNFLDMEEYKNLKENHVYRVFIVISIIPTYSYDYEYGKEFDGWDWVVLVLTSEDLGEINDDSSVEPK